MKRSDAPGWPKADRIRDWPARKRPRERLVAEGAERLTDAELLAIVPRVGRGTFKTGVAGLSSFRYTVSRASLVGLAEQRQYKRIDIFSGCL
jgi:DNA repair protein RadC